MTTLYWIALSFLGFILIISFGLYCKRRLYQIDQYLKLIARLKEEHPNDFLEALMCQFNLNDEPIFEKLAVLLTLDELGEAMPKLKKRCVHDMKILFDPHLAKCKDEDDFDEIEEKTGVTLTPKIVGRHAKKWLQNSHHYSEACRRFKELHEPGWGRKIIEEFGRIALQEANGDKDILKRIRDVYAPIIYSLPGERKTEYCPVYYAACSQLGK